MKLEGLKLAEKAAELASEKKGFKYHDYGHQKC